MLIFLCSLCACGIILIFIGIISLNNDEFSTIGVLAVIFGIVIFIIAICFIGYYIACSYRVEYINSRYDKNYTATDIFVNEDLIKMDLEGLYDKKYGIDLE